MRVLVVTSSWPRTGDELAGTFVRSDALVRARHADVTVAAPSGPGEARGGDGLTLVDVPHLGLFGSPGAASRLRENPLRALGLLPFARAIAAMGRFDRVVAHWLVPCGVVARALFGDVELIAHGGDVRLLEAMPRAASAALLRSLGPVRAVSHGLGDRLHALEPSLAITVSPMPLAIELDDARARGEALRDRVDGPLHVIAARMVPEKRIERAVAHAAAERATLALIGDGPSRASLLRAARARSLDVIAPGALPHEDALAWLAAADVVLAPLARGEGAPTVIREARALGKPVVVFE